MREVANKAMHAELRWFVSHTLQRRSPQPGDRSRSAIVCVMCEQQTEIRDLDALVGLVDHDRVSVDWTVTSAMGPEWIGSTRKLSFCVDGIPIAENSFTRRLAKAIIEAISIPETSEELVISGEGNLRRRGTLIEIVYEWRAANPYDWSSDSGSGVAKLMNIEND